LSLIDVSVGGIMTKEVKTIEGSRLLTEGVRLMRDAHIGSVVVVDGYRPAGIFTEQDLVSKIADGIDTLKVTMAQVMSMPLTTILPTASVWDALALMGRKNIRHLPVVHEDRLVGILTERDVVRLILSQHDLLFESISETYLLLRKIGSEGFLSRYGMDNPPTR
jgi:CBS domain-containing protein